MPRPNYSKQIEEIRTLLGSRELPDTDPVIEFRLAPFMSAKEFKGLFQESAECIPYRDPIRKDAKSRSTWRVLQERRSLVLLDEAFFGEAAWLGFLAETFKNPDSVDSTVRYSPQVHRRLITELLAHKRKVCKLAESHALPLGWLKSHITALEGQLFKEAGALYWDLDGPHEWELVKYKSRKFLMSEYWDLVNRAEEEHASPSITAETKYQIVALLSSVAEKRLKVRRLNPTARSVRDFLTYHDKKVSLKRTDNRR
jgi:hypothetical protein